MRKNYASRLTKEMLIVNGIDLITEDGCVFKNGKQYLPTANKKGYLVLCLYDLDENGNKIKVPMKKRWNNSEKIYDSYNYKAMTVGLHRAMWAWHYGEVPEGYVVDHINNQHECIEDYNLSNLQLLTQAENIAKERGESTKQLKCKLNKPLSFYEDKLNNYLIEYEVAKANHDADTAHNLRSNIANMKAKIRYWKANQAEAEKIKMENLEEEQRKIAWRKDVRDIKMIKELAKQAKLDSDLYRFHQLNQIARDWKTYDSKLKEQLIQVILKGHTFDL